MTRWSQYLASFSVVPLLALKVVDVSLERVEETLKTTSSLVQMARTTVISLRHGAARSAGTPLAKKIDELSLTGALGEVTGLNGLMERLGLAGNVSEATSAEEIQSEATGGVDTKKLEKAQKKKEKRKQAKEAKKVKADAEKAEKEKGEKEKEKKEDDGDLTVSESEFYSPPHQGLKVVVKTKPKVVSNDNGGQSLKRPATSPGTPSSPSTDGDSPRLDVKKTSPWQKGKSKTKKTKHVM